MIKSMVLTGSGVAAGGEGGGLVGGVDVLGGIGVGGHLLLLIWLGGLHIVLDIFHHFEPKILNNYL